MCSREKKCGVSILGGGRSQGRYIYQGGRGPGEGSRGRKGEGREEEGGEGRRGDEGEAGGTTSPRQAATAPGRSSEEYTIFITRRLNE